MIWGFFTDMLIFCLFLINYRVSAIMAIDDSTPERSEPEMMVMVKCNGDVVHHPDDETDLSCGSPEAVCLCLSNSLIHF